MRSLVAVSCRTQVVGDGGLGTARGELGRLRFGESATGDGPLVVLIGEHRSDHQGFARADRGVLSRPVSAR